MHDAKNRLIAGSELAGRRAAVVMSLVQSAKLDRIDRRAQLRDMPARLHGLPGQPHRRVAAAAPAVGSTRRLAPAPSMVLAR